LVRSGQRRTQAGPGAAPGRQFAIGEGLQVVNSTRGRTLARVSQWCVPMWLLFHSYPVILLASVLLLLTAITRQD
jgi:hypothetical protein